MKKVLILAVAMLMFALPAANAQKVNTSSEIAKLEKADADVMDAKKGIKAATWVARGNAYANAYILPTKELGQGIPAQVLQMNVGNPEGSYESTFQGMPSIVFAYEYVDVYVVNGMIEGWAQKKAVKENLAETAIESFAKAYELDPKQGTKISAGCATLANALIQQGEALNNMGNILEASRAFELAYTAECVVPEYQENGGNLYNAGMLMTMYASSLTGEEAIAAFQEAGILFAPGKAVNAGGVATSGLEMTQNCMHISWAGEEVDEKLHFIMKSIHEACVQFGTQADGTVNYVKGANIAGFMKVAQAMLEQGII